jgi:hypothetical protein
VELAVYYKVAGASEAGPYSWTFDTSSGSVGGIQSFSGAEATKPIDVEKGRSTPRGLTHDAPSLTTTVANTMIVTAHAFDSSATWTPPTGMTEAFDIASLVVPNVGGISGEGNYMPQTAVAATGAKTATASNDGDAGVTHTLALAPSGVKLVGSGTGSIANTGTTTLVSVSLTTTSAVTFNTGDRLVLRVIVPNDPANCYLTLSFDGAGVQSRLVVATIVPESVLGLLLLAPALPLAIRWWKRRRP